MVSTKLISWDLTPRKIIVLVLWMNLAWCVFEVLFHVLDKTNLQYDVRNMFGYYFNFETNILITWIETLLIIVSIARMNKEELSTLTYTIVIFFIDAIFSVFLMIHCIFFKPEKLPSSAVANVIRVYFVLLLSNSLIRIFSAFIIHLNKIEDKENDKELGDCITFDETISFSREANRALNIYVHSPREHI